MEQVNKNCFISINLLLIIISIIDWALAAEFAYKDEPFWPLKYPQCGGRSQSPVRIEYSQYDGGDPDATFSLINYDTKPSGVTLMNVGRTIRLEFDWGKNEPPYIGRGVFDDDEYVFDSMHFHWSRVSRHGSEHILFGFDGVMEMHLVHYNRNYGSVKNATNYDDGLVMIGALINTNAQRRRRDSGGDDDDGDGDGGGDGSGDNDDVYDDLVSAASQKSPAIGEILDNVGSVKTPGLSVDIDPFPVSDVRPVNLNKSPYISYHGSFSSPPCTENVLRVMSTYPYEITEEQFQYLQSTVEFKNGDNHNNRQVQPMNDRKFSVLWGVVENSN